jgi:hypothetical protein
LPELVQLACRAEVQQMPRPAVVGDLLRPRQLQARARRLRSDKSSQLLYGFAMTLSGRSRYVEMAGSELRGATWQSLLLAAWRSVGRYCFWLYFLRLSRGVSSSVAGDGLRVGAGASQNVKPTSSTPGQGDARRARFRRVDDKVETGLPTQVVVVTSRDTGLTDEDVERAVRILADAIQ